MKIRLGPILHAAPSPSGRWVVHVHVLLDGNDVPDAITADHGRAEGPTLAATLAGRKWWRYTLDLPREVSSYAVSYTLGALRVDGVRVPPRGRLPSIGFFSCNGFSDPQTMRRTTERYALWADLRRVHETDGLELLLGGGDQVYADSLWETERDLKRLGGLNDWTNVYKAKVSPAFRARLDAAFADLYEARWSQPDIAWVLARVPGAFTWDDHDIFDGWGSYEPALQATPVFQAVFAAAALAFDVFQCGGTRALGVGDPSHRLSALSCEGGSARLDLVLSDGRSARSRKEILGSAQWADLKRWFTAHEAPVASGARHVLFVTSVPLVYQRFPALAAKLGAAFTLDDDLLDQWEHPSRRGERDRLVMNLVDHAHRSRASVTILSGDVHVAARGRVTSIVHPRANGAPLTIEQLTSSGIVHPAPRWFEWPLLDLLGSERPDTLAPGIVAECVPIDGVQRYLLERNWLELRFDEGDRPRLWARFRTHRGTVEPQVVVAPQDDPG